MNVILKMFYKKIKFALLDFKYIFLAYIKYVVLNIDNDKTFEKIKNKRKMIVMQTPLHGNLGDQAIAYAEKKFLTENFNDIVYLEVSFEDVIKKAKNIKKSLRPGDIIFIHGGGNMGDMYLLEEQIRRFIVKFYKNTPIISFPQTISFSKSYTGNKELNKTKKIYLNNKNLLLIARESISFEEMKKHFGAKKVLFTPDIVLSLNEKSDTRREGILTCFRNDEEKALNGIFKKELINQLKKKYNKVSISDTVINKKITNDNREKELNKIWNEIKGSEVVITDRLHGMIFCAITNTPCIVFKNFNHKIICSYNDWLKDNTFINFIDTHDIKDTKQIISIVEDIRNNQNFKESGSQEKFHPLINYVENVKVN
ncbi:polysaccharide pyruvyl transferase family protein [Peribacillus muralis]|uniref:polysaccharide pyruvyl transferase family protein n=1 Tax=Peribacillus muralis TaxID=264697 RepID=UPI00367053BD